MTKPKNELLAWVKERTRTAEELSTACGQFPEVDRVEQLVHAKGLHPLLHGLLKRPLWILGRLQATVSDDWLVRAGVALREQVQPWILRRLLLDAEEPVRRLAAWRLRKMN